MQLRSSKDGGMSRHSSERSKQAAAAVAAHDQEVHEAAMTLFLAKFSGSTGVQGRQEGLYAQAKGSPRKLNSQTVSSSKRKLELSYSPKGATLSRVTTPESPHSKKQRLLHPLQQQQQQPSQKPRSPALRQEQWMRHQRHHQYVQQQQQQHVLIQRHKAIRLQRTVQTDELLRRQQQHHLLFRPLPHPPQQQQQQQRVKDETSSQTRPKVQAQLQAPQQETQRRPQQLRQQQLQFIAQAPTEVSPLQLQKETVQRQLQRQAHASAQPLQQHRQLAQQPALAPQHPTMQQLEGTQLPTPGQTIHFRLVVAGQCREFEGTVTPLDESAELPKYHSKGQLLGHIAVQHIKPMLPEDSRDKDVGMLHGLEGTSRVVALCRKMPFSVRRAGAWRLVVK